MPITKKFRKRSAVFESRFRDGSAVNFPLRQYLRCREDFTSGIVHAFLLAAFAVTLVLFGRTLNQLFVSHGQGLHPAYRIGALVALVAMVLSVLLRVGRKLADLKELRAAMSRYKSEFRNDEED